MNYKEKIKSVDTSRFSEQLRASIETAYTGYADVDLSVMLDVCTRRSLKLWQKEITPDLDIKLQREFERNLPDIKMRAGISIPRIFLFGYAFGVACHHLSNGKQENQLAIGATSGLYMFILGLFDHLMDDYPEVFGSMAASFEKDSIENYILKQEYDGLDEHADNAITKGLSGMYKAYFTRSQRIANANPVVMKTWCSELKRMHKVEAQSLDRRMNMVEPSAEISEHAVQPSLSAFRVLAISACLELDDFVDPRVEQFAKDYATLTWLVDDVVDLEKDLQADIWSGLAVRLATEVDDKADADKVIEDISTQAAALVTSMRESLGNLKWQPDDEFCIADILWYVVWSWCGGNVTPEKTAAVT